MATLTTETSFFNVALLLAFAGMFATFVNWLKQPLIIGYMLAGVLISNWDLPYFTFTEEISLLSKIGVSVLLFLVGLKLDIGMLKSMGKIALATGIGQIIFTSFFGYFICLALGYTHLSSFYIAIALTFSSTIIIVKLLSDKKEIDSLHGRIAIGLLIVQDIAVILIMLFISATKQFHSVSDLGSNLVAIILSLAVWGLIIFLFMRYVISLWTKRLSGSRELLLLFSVSWALIWSCLGELFGFSYEIGAFAAGMMLASTPYSTAIGARLVPLRDFLIPFFFLDLGAFFKIGILQEQIIPGIMLSLFVLVGNPLIVMAIMGYMGYRKRTGFLTGLTVAQISEFSLIFAALGVSLGHIGGEDMNLIAIVGLLTIALSTYLIVYSHTLYDMLASYLGIFERKVPFAENWQQLTESATKDVLLFGLGAYGSELSQSLMKSGLTLTAIDFDQQSLDHAKKLKIDCYYGDAEDSEFIDSLPLNHFKWIINTISTPGLSALIVNSLKEGGYEGKIAITVYKKYQEQHHLEKEVDLILNPFKDAAVEASDLLLENNKHSSQ